MNIRVRRRVERPFGEDHKDRFSHEGGVRRRASNKSDPKRIKQMSTITAVSLAVALMAVLSGAWTSFSSQAMVAETKADAQPTLMAVQDIKAGDKVVLSMFETKDVPRCFRMRDALSAEALSNESLVAGKRALVDIPAGSQITTSLLSGTAESGYLAAALDTGMQAVTIEVDAETGLAGQLRPADYVRVVALGNGAGGEVFTRTICDGVRVVSLDDRLSGGDGGYASVTLEVDGHQADEIRTAQYAGTVSLVLISSFDGLEDEEVARG